MFKTKLDNVLSSTVFSVNASQFGCINTVLTGLSGIQREYLVEYELPGLVKWFTIRPVFRRIYRIIDQADKGNSSFPSAVRYGWRFRTDQFAKTLTQQQFGGLWELPESLKV
ncbi:MAG: hypothetical protein NXI22_16495 [bacterium]|nr:hypothetical protein [bacterium]